MLAKIYGWFNQGVNTVDLKGAKAVLGTRSLANSLRRRQKRPHLDDAREWEVAESLSRPGRPKTLDKWHECSAEAIGEKTRNYLASRDWPSDHPKTKEQVLRWLEELLEDGKANPGHKAKNAEALFLEVNRIGGLRGARRILRQASHT